MRGLRFFRLLSAMAILPVSLSAQQATSPSGQSTTSDPQAVALLQKALALLTGGASITDVTFTGTARRIAGSDDETGTATLKATALGDSRIDLSFPFGNRSEIRNHSALPLPGGLPPGTPTTVAQTPQPVGAWSGPDGTRHAMSSHNVVTDSAWFMPGLTLARLLAAPNAVLSYVGQETRAGQSVLHVSASQQFSQLAANTSGTNTLSGPPIATLMQHLSQTDMFLDPTTLLPVAMAYATHPDGNALMDIPTEIRFSDYRAVNGILVPFHVQRYLNNGLALDLQFANVTTNSGLTAAAFSIQ